MKFEIVDLYLENFAKIHSGMHIDKLYLDFSEMPHQTYLFVGDSGSGKSSILKSIHPFAFNSATGDESANGDLIIAKRNGRKIIRYILDNKEITCTHLYQRKPDDTIQTKSFFSVNGEELNPSGLVTTFKELVQQYFCIDESFLTLLALGNSVKSMVEYTAGERKKLAVKIFSELNIYMTYYKNATSVVRDLKSVLSNVVDKLDRYGSYDKKDILKQTRQIEHIINELDEQLANALRNEGQVKANLDINKEAYEQYESCEGRVTELLTTIEKIKSKRKTSQDVTVLENEQNGITKSIISTQLKIESLESTITSELDFKEVKLSSKNNLEDSIKRMENNTNKIELEKLLANVEAELVSLSDIDIEEGVDYTKKKEDFVTASIYLDELRGLCTDLITEVRDQELIPSIVKNFLKNKHFGVELDVAYNAILEKISTMESMKQISGSIKIPKISPKDSNTCSMYEMCPYYKFYKNSVEILSAKKDQSDKIFKVEQDKLTVAEDKRKIYYILEKLYKYIDGHNEYFKLVPKKIFDPKTFIIQYLGMDRQIYDVGMMSNMISYLEQAVRKVQLVTLQKTTKDQLVGLETTISLYDSMKVDLERTIRAIEETDKVIEHHQKDLEFNKSELEKLNQSSKELSSEIELAKELENCRNEIQEVQRQLNSMEECKKNFDALSLQFNKIQTEVSAIRLQLDNNNKELNRLRNTLDAIESLEKEKKLLTDKYAEAMMIRDAVSPSKGIPVEFIDDVIRNQMIDSINELMHVAYPSITLIKDPNKLIIDDKEFTIPYKKNGVIIGDISEASDGERAMLSLAFSLVLIRLVSKVYNIMLLDEMDTALDKYGRSKYIDIIERYMKTINATQIFLISHNSMFDMYNVNVLQTTESVTSPSENKFVVNVPYQNFTPEDYKLIKE